MSESVDQLLKTYLQSCDYSIDSSSRKKALEMSCLCCHVYGGEGHLPDGWLVCTREVEGLKKRDESCGFRSELYTNGSKYVLAFAGVHDNRSAFESALQLVGKSDAYKLAAGNAALVVSAFGLSNVSFTGHSLGGGLVTAAAVFTGAPAITFNPAWLSSSTRSELLKFPSVEVINYVIFAEALDVFQRHPQLLNSVPAGAFFAGLLSNSKIQQFGTFKYIYCKVIHDRPHYIDAHLIETIIEELRKENGEKISASDLAASSLHEDVMGGMAQLVQQKMSVIMEVVASVMSKQFSAGGFGSS